VKALSFKMLSMFAALALLVPVFLVPTVAAQAQEKCQREEVVYLDAEVRVIDGKPVIVVETEKGYVNIPFELTGEALVDGQKVVLKTQGNAVLVPTKEGPVAVPVEEFCVVIVDEQVALMAEENPPILIAVGKAFATVTTAAKWYLKWALIDAAQRANR
jgi:hypothetical protein